MLLMGGYIACLVLFLQIMSIEKINVFNAGVGFTAIIFQVLMLGYGRAIRYLNIQFFPEKNKLAVFDRFLAPVIYLVGFQLAFHADPHAISQGFHYLLVAVLLMQSSKSFRTGEWFWKLRIGQLKYYNDTGKTQDPADVWRETTKYRLVVIGIAIFLAYLWLRGFLGLEG